MELEDWKNFLKGHPVFSKLTRREIDGIMKVSRTCTFRKGETIIREGEGGKSVFLLGRGAVDVVLRWGSEQTIRLATRHEGEFFGEMALFDDSTRRSATVVAAEDCELLDIQGTEFLKIAAAHPEIESDVINKLTGMLRDVNEQVIKVKLKNLDERLDVMNTRIDSQQQATEATLRATQTIFEQTNTRANEIINSADRSRHRLMQAAGAIGTVVSVFVAIIGWLGFNEFEQIRSFGNEVEKARNQVVEDAAKVKAGRERLEQIEEQAKDTVKEIEAVSQTLTKTRIQMLVRLFEEALRADGIWGAVALYSDLQSLDPRSVDPHFVTKLLGQVEAQMAADGGEIIRAGKDYAPLLKAIEAHIAPAQDSAGTERIVVSYLLLANAIARNDDTYAYDKAFSNLAALVKEHKDHKVGVEPSLVSVVVGPEDRSRFCRLGQIVPWGDDPEGLLQICGG